MFMTAFYGFFRIGELSCARKKQVVTILQFDHLTFLKQSSQVTAVKIVITKFKHNTNNRPFVITIQRKPSETFCPCRPHSTTLNFGLTKKAPCSRVQMAGQSRPIILSSVVLWPFIAYYMSHSFRIGAACHVSEKGFSDSQIRALGRWRSDIFTTYIRPSSLKVD